jgi:tRNA G10  N-methylase Trm11
MPTYLYTYTCHDDERLLSGLELRSFFGFEPSESVFFSHIEIDPSRSPFIKERVDIQFEGSCPSDLAEQVQSLEMGCLTFKVKFIKTGDDIPFEERREIERVIGANITGKAEMRKPDETFGVANLGGRWVLGRYLENKAVWLKHNKKAQNYSTALSTRLSRAIVNIAVPHPQGIKAIDPCCGIGTVVIEALSMGIDIVGYDINWMAIRGARLNLQHFGYPDVVKVADMRTLNGRYEAAILDLPYNLCSKLPKEEQVQMLRSAKRLARKIVVISTEAIDEIIKLVGLKIVDRCTIRKSTFVRELLVCSS